MHIKKGDNVKVIAGKDKGKEGKVVATEPKKGRVVVEGVNVIKKHQKPTQLNPEGGILEKEKFNTEVTENLVKKFNYSSVMEVPKIEKIVVNMGVGDAVQNSKVLDNAVEELELITGQKPLVTKAKKSVATFRLREGMPIGAKVTLRGERMYEFLDKLIAVSLPRVRDFQGVSKTAFDGRGNYTLGVKEQLIFPEIDYDKVTKVRGMDIVIVTTANTDEEARELLTNFGMPFRK